MIISATDPIKKSEFNINIGAISTILLNPKIGITIVGAFLNSSIQITLLALLGLNFQGFQFREQCTTLLPTVHHSNCDIFYKKNCE